MSQREEGDCALTVEATPSSDVAGRVMGEDEASSRETSSHDGVREGDRGHQLDQGNVITGEGTHTLRFIIDLQLFLPVMFTENIFLIFSKISQSHDKVIFYRMKKGFHFSCTMMLAVPISATPSSVSIRLCFPMATLYSLPLLQVHRQKNMKP